LLAALVTVSVVGAGVRSNAQSTPGTGHGQHGQQGHGGHQRGEAGAAKLGESPDCATTGIECASAVTPYVAPDGTLWVVWSAAKQIFVARSDDKGRTFRPAVAITRGPAMLDGGADARPQIVVDRQQRIVVSYAVLRGDRYVGQVLVSHSSDRGATFSAPVPISDHTASQRFVSLGLDGSGDIFATWVDKRRLLEAQQAGRPFAGASLAVSWSRDGGRTFGPATIVHDQMCECCRLAVSFKDSKQPVVLFRNIFDGERDHAVVTLAKATPASASASGSTSASASTAASASAPISRVGDDHWKIEACPHHGPSLAVDASGNYHAAWFTGSEQRQGLFYARSVDAGRTFSPPIRVGAEDHQPGRAQLLANGDQLWLAWKEYADGVSTIQVMLSRDAGRTWSTPRRIAQTSGASDHPLLIASGGQTLLSWLTRAEGYRVLPLAPTGAATSSLSAADVRP
jgi:hypothetical protein